VSAEQPRGGTRPSTDALAPRDDEALDLSEEAELDLAVMRTLDWAEREQIEGPMGLPAPQSVGLLGQVLGDYRVLGELGRGGMGVVLEAEPLNGEPGRVAIKVLDDLMPSDKALARFARESQALGRLDHPNVVPLIAAHPGSSSAKPFTVMQFVDGVSLSELLLALARRDGRPRWASEVATLVPGASSFEGGGGPAGSYVDWVLALGVALARGLAHAHENGVVHRDIKPANIMLTPEGVPVIVDFGLAIGENDKTLTATGAFLGTLPYSPPEQIDGAAVDARSDVYALGVTLYELMAVARPFVAAGRRELLVEIESGDGPAPVDGVSREVLTVLRMAMHADPDHRYQDAGAFARDLAACARGSAIEARAPSWWQLARRSCRRHPLAVAVTVVLLLAAGGLASFDHLRALRLVDQASTHWAAAETAGQALLACEVELSGLEDPTGLRLLRSADERLSLTLNAQRDELRVLFDHELEVAESQAFQAAGFVGGSGGAERLMGKVLRSRIERSLVEQRDVLDPVLHGGLVQRLRALGPPPELLTGLMEPSPLSISTDPPGAAFEVVDVRDGQVLAAGLTPHQRLLLPEGSYLVKLALHGRLPTAVPVVVRSRAAAMLASYEPDLAPPWSTVDVTLPALDARPPGWTHIPSGASLVGAARPRWLWLDEYWMQTFEVTLEAVLDCLNDARAMSPISLDSSTMLKPRYADNLQSLEVRRGAGGDWQAGPEVKDLAWPARGLSQDDVGAFVDYASQVLAPQPAGWYLALPTDAEWERAARGADGRLYPWGNDYRVGQCVDAHFDLDGDPELWPQVVGLGAADVSVFGIHDLAGSVAERTESAFETQRAVFAVRGGSYLDRDTLRMNTRSRRGVGNRPVVDVGFRLVMRKQPSWLAAADHPPSFRDDFERPDGDSVGAGWVEVNAHPLKVASDPGTPESCTLAAGRLVCTGGEGNGSNMDSAWHGVGGEGRAFLLKAKFTVETLRPLALRSASLRVLPEVERWQHGVSLAIDSSGGLGLSVPPAHYQHQLAGLDGEHWCELASDGEQVTVRVWPAGAPRPPRAQLEAPLPIEFDKPAFVVAAGGNYAAVRLSVDELIFDGAP